MTARSDLPVLPKPEPDAVPGEMCEAVHIIAAAAGGIGLLGAGYAGLITGAVAADLGIGRQVRPLEASRRGSPDGDRQRGLLLVGGPVRAAAPHRASGLARVG